MFSWGMSGLFEINRGFPYQVALPFDEIAMGVLAWLDDRSFEWDMYVAYRLAPFGIVSARRQMPRHLSSGSRVLSKDEP